MSASTLVMNNKKGRKVPSIPLQEPRAPTTPRKEAPEKKEEERPKKPPRPRIYPADRDRLQAFASRRNEVKDTKDRLYAVIVKRLAQLSMDYLAKKPASSAGMFSFLWGGGDSSVHIPVVGVELNLPVLDEDAKACTACGTLFGYFQKRVHCELCMRYCCTKCALPRVPLQVINDGPKPLASSGAVQPQTPMINSCERCCNIVKNWKYHQKFQRAKFGASNNPLVAKYDMLLKRDENVVEALIKYEACVAEADPPKGTKKAPGEPENILAMRLGETSHVASQVEKQLQAMAIAIQEIKNFAAPPDPSKPIPVSETVRKLVHTIHTTASTRLEGHISYYQSLQRRLLRLQLTVVGDVYNKFQQLIIEVNQLQSANEEKTAEKNGQSGPNIYLMLREVLTVIKAEIQELMVTMGKQQWEKFEKTLNNALKMQMAHGQKLLNIPQTKEGDPMYQKLLMTKLVSVVQHEGQILENNTAIATLKESKRIIKNTTTNLLSHYF